MRIHLLVLLAAMVGPLCGDSLGKSEGALETIRLSVKEASPTGTVVVQISNGSNNPCRIWKESNSWGASRWRLLRIRKGQVVAVFQDPDKEFTKNGPEFSGIPPGGHIDQKLDPNDGGWHGLGGQKMRFEHGDLIVVIYDVPFTQESLRLNVWYGVAVASVPFP